MPLPSPAITTTRPITHLELIESNVVGFFSDSMLFHASTLAGLLALLFLFAAGGRGREVTRKPFRYIALATPLLLIVLSFPFGAALQAQLGHDWASAALRSCKFQDDCGSVFSTNWGSWSAAADSSFYALCLLAIGISWPMRTSLGAAMERTVSALKATLARLNSRV